MITSNSRQESRLPEVQGLTGGSLIAKHLVQRLNLGSGAFEQSVPRGRIPRGTLAPVVWVWQVLAYQRATYLILAKISVREATAESPTSLCPNFKTQVSKTATG